MKLVLCETWAKCKNLFLLHPELPLIVYWYVRICSAYLNLFVKHTEWRVIDLDVGKLSGTKETKFAVTNNKKCAVKAFTMPTASPWSQ